MQEQNLEELEIKQEDVSIGEENSEELEFDNIYAEIVNRLLQKRSDME